MKGGDEGEEGGRELAKNEEGMRGEAGSLPTQECLDLAKHIY